MNPHTNRIHAPNINNQSSGFKAVFNSNKSFFGVFQKDIPFATYNTTSTLPTICSVNSHLLSTTLPALCYHPTYMQHTCSATQPLVLCLMTGTDPVPEMMLRFYFKHRIVDKVKVFIDYKLKIPITEF
jgi:hypothetical protein